MDKRSFAEIFESNYRFSVDLAFKILKDKEWAKDIASQVFENLFRLGEKIYEIKNMCAYIHTMTTNICITELNKNKLHQKYVKTLVEETEEIQIEEIRSLVLMVIYEEMEKLTGKKKDILYLLMHKISPKKISKIMGIKYQTVINHKNQAIVKIKEALKTRLN